MLNGDYCENKSPDNNTQTITSDMIKGLYLAKKSPFKYKGGIINTEIKHGFGVIYYENSVDKYIGNFYNNKSNGICRFIKIFNSWIFIGFRFFKKVLNTFKNF